MPVLVDEGLYARANDIGLKVPNSVCIIGCGGVGGWIAFKMALIGVANIILVDPDVLEESNLGRLPYKYDQIGEYKVFAMQELIRERRMCNIFAYPCTWEDVPADVKTGITSLRGENCSIMIDARDSITPLEGITKSYITGGYDGSNITIHTFPNFNNIWGEDEVRYRTTPSYIVPPDLIAMLIVNFICYEMHYNENIRVEEIFSFDVRNLYEIIKMGVKIKELEIPLDEIITRIKTPQVLVPEVVKPKKSKKSKKVVPPPDEGAVVESTTTSDIAHLNSRPLMPSEPH